MLMRLVQVLVPSLIAVLLTTGAVAQVNFWVESPIVPPGQFACVQVGVFLNVSGANQEWMQLSATLDYEADPGVLAGTPHARISDFPGMSPPVLTNPGTPLPSHSFAGMDPCHPSVITNSVILSGGPPIAFIGGGGTVIVSENVNPMTADSGRITLLADGNFETTGLQDELFAVLTFMVTGNPGGIRITFSDAMPGANALVDRSEMTVAASTTGGALQVGGPSTTVPTLSQWGMIAFLSGLVLSAFIFLRRRSTFA